MFVLQDSLQTKRRKKPVYLHYVTGIGPAYTDRLEEAEKFDSKVLAMESPAYMHSMCFFEPVEISK